MYKRELWKAGIRHATLYEYRIWKNVLFCSRLNAHSLLVEYQLAH